MCVKKRSGFRTIHCESGDWQYKVGKQYVIIYSPSGKRHLTSCGKISGVYDWDRARWKRNDKITPRMIKSWIEVEINENT